MVFKDPGTPKGDNYHDYYINEIKTSHKFLSELASTDKVLNFLSFLSRIGKKLWFYNIYIG